MSAAAASPVRRMVATPDGEIALRIAGEGPPLVLLHGWPETAMVWDRVLPLLARGFRVVAPDLRGFGDSMLPNRPATLADHVADLAAVLDLIGAPCAGLVGHDVGAQVAQAFALEHPGRVGGLFFFDCPHPGIGRRWVENGHVNEIWYQSFQQLPLAARLAGRDREGVRLYLGHFLSHWAGAPEAMAELLEPLTDAYARPGRLEASFGWYRAANALRLAQIDRGAQPRPRISAPAACLWGARDPIIPPRFAEGIDAYFERITVEFAANAGHFVMWERPTLAAARIAAFFTALGELAPDG